MPIYSRPEKSYCILKESNVQKKDSYNLTAQRKKQKYKEIEIVKP